MTGRSLGEKYTKGIGNLYYQSANIFFAANSRKFSQIALER